MNEQHHKLAPTTEELTLEQSDIDFAASQEEDLRKQAEQEHLKQRVVLLRALANRRKQENDSLRQQLRLLEERLNAGDSATDTNE